MRCDVARTYQKDHAQVRPRKINLVNLNCV